MLGKFRVRKKRKAESESSIDHPRRATYYLLPALLDQPKRTTYYFWEEAKVRDVCPSDCQEMGLTQWLVTN